MGNWNLSDEKIGLSIFIGILGARELIYLNCCKEFLFSWFSSGFFKSYWNLSDNIEEKFW